MSGFMLDQPHEIQAFALMQIYFKLKLEVEHPGGPKWRVPPSKQARAILVDNEQPDPGPRKINVFCAYGAWLQELGVLQPVI